MKLLNRRFETMRHLDASKRGNSTVFSCSPNIPSLWNREGRRTCIYPRQVKSTAEYEYELDRYREDASS